MVTYPLIFQYFHQLGSRINSYTATLFGERGAALSRKRSAPARNHNSFENATSFRNVDSFVSVKSALTVTPSRHPAYSAQESVEEKKEKEKER